MKITFFIGNGYDMNIGLKTGYADFLKWYIAQPSSETLIVDFKKEITSGIKYWSDLEIALGRKTLAYPLNTKNSFRTCKFDLDTQLQKYLQEQNRFIRKPSEEDIEVFKQSIVKFPLHCSSADQAELKRIYNTHRYEEYEYNIVNFNFTNTVDVFWEAIPDNAFWHKISYPQFMAGESFRIDDKKGQLFHIHGTLDNAMMTGVGEPEQLVNTIFQRTDIITSLCVKPIMNENCRNQVENNISELIDGTDVFVVYGMSIGITDIKWWRSVVCRLLTEENSYLLIVNYDKDFNPALPYTSSLVAKKIVSNLIDVSGCPPKYQDKLKNKIAVSLNTSLFNYTSVLQSESIAS